MRVDPHNRRTPSLAKVAVLLAATSVVDATRFVFRNECPFLVDLWDNNKFENLAPNGGEWADNFTKPGLMFRYGYNPQATLAEFSVVGDGRVWYDISIIPPGTQNCKSYEDCQRVAAELGGVKGFNVPLAIIPLSNQNGVNCRALYCMQDPCQDAYLFPYDDLKVHNCPEDTVMQVVFCPDDPSDGIDISDDDSLPDPVQTAAPTPAPTPPPTTAPSPTSNWIVKSKFEYRGKYAGNMPGFYNQLSNLAACTHQPVYMNSPVGPLSEEVSLVFRGPMEIYNIGVFDGSSGIWQRVSWYRRGGLTKNMVFLNNKNVDYSGLDRWNPQIHASSDGRNPSTEPAPFSGTLGDASDPSVRGGGPGIDTGVEVNIMTSRQCQPSDPCQGWNSGDYNYHGWGGGRKIFVARVKMPWSTTGPNMPAMWMLNAQVLHAGQYDPCNCRGMGAAGGCGELDIAEVINDKPCSYNYISTHHYFFDGSVPNPPNGDNFAPRPTTKSTVYMTIIDDTVPGGLIKILEIETFNFALDRLTNRYVQRLINA